MNRALASTLDAINALLALILILFGALLGYGLMKGSLVGLLLGGLFGLIFAAVTCGVIAYLALIERHLAVIAGTVTPPRIR